MRMISTSESVWEAVELKQSGKKNWERSQMFLQDDIRIKKELRKN